VKPHQLLLAEQLGFNVPRYTITSDPDVARDFLSECGSNVVCKGLGQPTLLYDDGAAILYTHLVTQNDLQHLDQVSLCPTLLQECISKRSDVRVIVIGDEVFAVEILSQEHDSANIDFRSQNVFDLEHRTLTLPAVEEWACRSIVSRLGLRFGAIDLVRGQDGRFHFLEVNPNGQWLWLEWATDVPLTEAMCRLLTCSPTSDLCPDSSSGATLG
jgi:glutathione synthase/RimK-type ligase-like ATP-grasp enzyme